MILSCALVFVASINGYYCALSADQVSKHTCTKIKARLIVRILISGALLIAASVVNG